MRWILLCTLGLFGMTALLGGCSCAEEWKRAAPAVFAPKEKKVKACVKEPAWTLFVDATQGSDQASGKCAKSDGKGCGPLKSLSVAFSKAKAGDAIHLQPGTWKEDLQFKQSGSKGKPIILGSTGKAVIEGLIDLKGHSHITFWGVTLHSRDGRSWVLAKQGEHHISFEYVGFDSFNGVGVAFQGVEMLKGHDIRFCGCAMGQWLGDMFYAREVDRLDFAYNDGSQGRGDHAILAWTGKDLRVRNNTFHNPWDRVLHITDGRTIKSTGAVIENNVFVLSNWDRKSRRPVTDNDQSDGGGAWEVVRLLGKRHIFRNNLVLAAGKGVGHPCSGALTFTTFSNSYYHTVSYAHIRVYHNTFSGNELNDIAFLTNATPESLSDNRILRNVFSGSGTHAISWCKKELPRPEWWIQGNLFSTQARLQDGEGNSITLGVIKRSFWKKNFTSGMSFQDAASWQKKWSHSQRADLWTHFQLAQKTEKAPPLAILTQDTKDATNLALSDAFVFSDGGGMVPGDTILVEQQPVKILRIIDANHIEVSNKVTAAKGAMVSFVGGSSSPGVYNSPEPGKSK